MGDEQIEIPFSVMGTLKEWNQTSNNVEMDKHVVAALLLVCVKEDDIFNHVVSQDVKSFICGKNHSEKVYYVSISSGLNVNV